MKKELIAKPASQEEIYFFSCMGDALCKTQILEQAVSHSITLKKNSKATKLEADKELIKHSSYTLGQAVKLAKVEKLFPSELQEVLEIFLQERNWLVHKVIAEATIDGRIKVTQDLIVKIKKVSHNAEIMQHNVELDLVDFCRSMGKDMPSIRKILKEREKASD